MYQCFACGFFVPSLCNGYHLQISCLLCQVSDNAVFEFKSDIQLQTYSCGFLQTITVLKIRIRLHKCTFDHELWFDPQYLSYLLFRTLSWIVTSGSPLRLGKLCLSALECMNLEQECGVGLLLQFLQSLFYFCLVLSFCLDFCLLLVYLVTAFSVCC